MFRLPTIFYVHRDFALQSVQKQPVHSFGTGFGREHAFPDVILLSGTDSMGRLVMFAKSTDGTAQAQNRTQLRTNTTWNT